MEKIEKGSVILSHNDSDYGLVQDSSEDVTYTKLMVPNSEKDDYRAGIYNPSLYIIGLANKLSSHKAY